MKDLKALPEKLSFVVEASKKYLPLLFCLLLLLVYGFLAYRINVFSNQAPSVNDINTQSRTSQVPHIDQATLTQLKNLQDNSVNVKSLFNDARSNPFQE